MIGSSLTQAFGHQAVPLGKTDLDITNPVRFRELCLKHKPSIVINAAGVYDPTPQVALEMNVQAPGKLAQCCAELGIRFVFLSTSRVFGAPGNRPWLESDIPDPIDDYGKNKLEGERLVRKAAQTGDVCILRLPMVLGVPRNPENQIITRLLLQVAQGKKVQVANDVMHSPVDVETLGTTIRNTLDAGVTGMLHIGSADEATLYDIFKLTTELLGFQAEIEPVKSAELGNRPHPINLALSSTRRDPCPGWRDAVKNFVEAIRNSAFLR